MEKRKRNTRPGFEKAGAYQAFEISDDTTNRKRIKISSEMKKIRDYSDEKKPVDHTELLRPTKGRQRSLIATGSSYKSAADIIKRHLDFDNKSQAHGEVKNIDPKSIKVDPEKVCEKWKACVLARKYARQHYMLRSISRQKYTTYTEKQIAAIYSIVAQIKSFSSLPRGE
jgi:hypothetical protein